MPVECFSDDNGRYVHVTCTLSQTCCENKCCDKSSDFMFYQHWYFWVAVTVLLLLVIGAVLSGYCQHCRKPISCAACGFSKKLGIRLGRCTWVWSLDEDKSPSTFLGFQTEKAPQSPTSLSDQETALFCPPKAPPDHGSNGDDTKPKFTAIDI
ncbi:hypothetical protein EGW08_012671 [Elysia chlorotica]|uniref:Vesicular, overexpressed in cancer, prosurvival protein 1 n=1 Tax=Elysia chlorotica TaxID=188477 RepID=A0A3S0ZPB0_ELYCH|nr:hypothetical protein EGW08_012671 [Elysia chlorotica]